MKSKKIPERVCIACKLKKPKSELMRVVLTKEGEISLDTTHKKAGRGAYVCKNRDCLEKAIKNGGLQRSLKTKIDENIFESLEACLDEG